MRATHRQRRVLPTCSGLLVSLVVLMTTAPPAEAHARIKLVSCGQVTATGTPYPVFLVRASRMSCRSARAVLLSWAHHPSRLAKRRAGGWYCRSAPRASVWFYCAKNLARQRIRAEAFHVSSSKSSPSASPSPAGSPPGGLSISLSTESPVIGQPISATVSPPGDYAYQWWACPESTFTDGCSAIGGSTGPTFFVDPVCIGEGVAYNPYYAGVSVTSNQNPNLGGQTIATGPIMNNCR
jgi:hypothetical protein